MHRRIHQILGNRHKWFKKVDWSKCFKKKMIPPLTPVLSDPFDTSNFDKYPESKEGSSSTLSAEENKKVFGDFGDYP